MHPFFQGYEFYGFVHRGGDEVKSENTFEAFQHSSDMGFVYMETDVQSTKDGYVVIFHDANLKRMAGLNKKVKDLTLEEIKSIDLIDGGKIPLLSETLENFPDLKFNIDIKTEDAVEEAVKIILSMNCLDRTCLASFSSKRLKKIRFLAGSGVCSSSGQMDIFRMVCRSYGINIKSSDGDCAQIPRKQWGIPILTDRFLKIAHEENKFVHIWTIDDKTEMLELIDLGVDGLMTDKPSILKQAMIERGIFN